MAFEPARNSRCTTPIAPASISSHQIMPWTSQPDHCGPCVDVPLLSSEGDPQLVPASPPLLTLDGPVLALAMPVISLPGAPAAPTSAWSFFPAVSPMLMALRTVVLRL
jgi:hypothetical protein